MKSFKQNRVELSQEEQRQYRRLQTQKAMVESLQHQLKDDREALQSKNASLKATKEKAREAQRLADAKRLQIKDAQTEAAMLSKSKSLLNEAKKLQKTPEGIALIDALIDINRKYS